MSGVAKVQSVQKQLHLVVNLAVSSLTVHLCTLHLTARQALLHLASTLLRTAAHMIHHVT